MKNCMRIQVKFKFDRQMAAGCESDRVWIVLKTATSAISGSDVRYILALTRL